MQSINVWDVPVRVCHWGLAACVAANLWFTEEGGTIHQYIGYTAAGIVLFRLFWGMVGSRHARFSDFWPTPRRLRHHIRSLLRREPETHAGHNPLGALMMLVLWAVVIGLGVSGYLMESDRFYGVEIIEETHEILAESLMPLIALHVLSALAMSLLLKSNLIAAMISGKKTIHSDTLPKG